MEKNVIFWIIGIIVVAAVFFNLGDFTANVAKSGVPITREPFLRVLTSTVSAGSNLLVNVDNIGSLSSSRLQIFYQDGTYSGVSFPIPRGDCNFASAGRYNCQTSYKVPHSILPNGQYYVQVKSDSSGDVVGNKGFFTIKNSQYQETGR